MEAILWLGKPEVQGIFNGDVYLVKVNSSGVFQWDKSIGGGSAEDRAFCVLQTNDGGYIVAGNTDSYGAGGSDVYVIKTDSNANVTWTRTFGGTADDVGRSVIQLSNGDYLVADYTYGYGAGFIDYYLIRLSPSGTVLWNKTYGGNSYDVCYEVEETNDGGFILAGSGTNFGTGNFDGYLVKTNSSGTVLWSKVYGGSNDDRFLSVTQTADRGYITCGRTQSFGNGFHDAYVVKTDSVGTVQWTKAFGGTNWEEAYCIRQTTDGGYVMAGMTISFGTGGRSMYAVKMDANGVAGCNELSTNTVTNTANTQVASGGSSGSGGVSGNPPTAVRNTATVIDLKCAQGSVCNVTADFVASANSVCAGGSMEFTNQSSGATSYVWLQNGVQVDNSTNLLRTFSTGGTITMILVASDSSCTDSFSLSVVIHPPVNVNLTNVSNVDCFGAQNGTATASVTSGSLPYAYFGSNGDTNSSTSGLGPGPVSVIVVDNFFCEDSASVVITEPPALVASLDSTRDVSCNGSNDGRAWSSVTGGTPPYSYLWSTGDTTPTANFLGPGNHSLIVTDARQCTDTSFFTLMEPAPVIISLDSLHEPCKGEATGSIYLSATSGNPGTISWLWPNGATGSSRTGLIGGTYIVTATDINGCTDTDTLVLNENPKPEVTVSVNPATQGGCDGSATATVTSGTSPYSYQWDDSLQQTTPTAIDLCAGTYSVTVTDANGCDSTVTFTLLDTLTGRKPEVNQLPGISIFPNPFSESITVEGAAGFNGEVNIQVRDLLGRKVYEKTLVDPFQSGFIHKIQLDAISSGGYWLKIRVGDQVMVRKIFKR